MLSRLILSVMSSAALLGCGQEAEDKPATVVYGTLTVTGSTTQTDNGSWDLTTLTKCTRNADTGRVDAVVGLSTGQSLTVAIKNYSSTAKKYTCVQAADNKESTSDVGGKFDDCMVDAKALSATGSSTVNGYSMHRDSISTKPFSYAGECSIDVTQASPSIKATISCLDMVQTVLESAARNPINAEVNADVAATLDCPFQ
jgi:hypothetical protein